MDIKGIEKDNLIEIAVNVLNNFGYKGEDLQMQWEWLLNREKERRMEENESGAREIQFVGLSEEEIELIKQHRKGKMELVIEQVTKDEVYVKETSNIEFKARNEGMTISTRNDRYLGGEHEGSNGYFWMELTQKEVKDLHKFLGEFLGV